MTFETGFCSFNINDGTSLTLSNVLSGNGTIYLNYQVPAGTLALNGNSPSYSGNVSLYTGSAVVNGTIGGTITSQSGTTVSGGGSVGGLVDVSGAFLPGTSGVAEPSMPKAV